MNRLSRLIWIAQYNAEYARQHHADRKNVWREATCCIAIGLLRLLS
jgi:hypothetical protein